MDWWHTSSCGEDQILRYLSLCLLLKGIDFPPEYN